MDITKQIFENTIAFEERQRKQSSRLVQKYTPLGLLENLKEQEQAQVAQLLENQVKQLIRESNNSTNNNSGANREEWNGVALPLVRRIFDEINAKEFVSVQPMNQPSGLIFYLDFKYGTSIGPAGSGDGSNNFGQQTSPAGNKNLNSLFGITDVANSDPAGGLYGAGRFGYTSKNYVTATMQTGSAGAVSTTALGYSTVTTSDINYDTDFSASVWAVSSLTKVQVSSSMFTNADFNGVRAFAISSSGAAIYTHYPEYTTYTPTTGLVTFIVSGASSGFASQTFSVMYQKQPISTARGDFEATGTSLSANPEVDINIPELDIEMRQEPIVAKTRKLKAQWTPEFSQDLNTYHSIDAELELTQMLSNYISQEIDFEILDMLIANANTTEYWSAQIDRIWNGSSFTTGGAAAAAYNQGTWFQTLGTKLRKVSNAIAQKTMRGGANFMVVSPQVATIIESIPGYAADTDGSKKQFNYGVQKIGAVNNSWLVYKNPYMLSNRILMGYRGQQFLETGAVYSPYVPLIMTPLVYDPKNFTPRKGVMTRYAKKMVRAEFYGQVFVEGLQTV